MTWEGTVGRPICKGHQFVLFAKGGTNKKNFEKKHQVVKKRQKRPKMRDEQYESKTNRSDIEKTIVILYHKPKDIITSHSNQDSVPLAELHNFQKCGRATVYQDIMTMEGYLGGASGERINASTSEPKKCFEQVTGIKSKLHAVGRLDAETTGLLLITNDGGLVHHVTNPTAATAVEKGNNGGNKILKTYEAVIMGHHTLPSTDLLGDMVTGGDGSNSLLELFQGVNIGKKYGGMTKPVHDLRILGHPTSKSTRVTITIGEGKNRQVRRMFHSIGSGVMQLHRLKVGNLSLDMLGQNSKEGDWRILSEKEIMTGLGWRVKVLSSSGQRPSHKASKSRSRRR